TSNAQINSGTMVAGGSASFNHRAYPNGISGSTSLSIQPQFGIAVADNFLVGGWFRMYSIKDVRSNFSVSPFVRYYVNNFYAQGGYGFSYSKAGDISSTGSIIDFELGYAAFLNDNIALEPAFYYNATFSGKSYIYSDFGFKIGFQIYFNR
ncbi:MAG: hypothetical protein HRT57_11420, partial [Crocinitomicaceae bacterium]|nr:hypothetical protein [Crocinitomicaceae bacterium]